MFRAALYGWKVGDGAGTSTPSESVRAAGLTGEFLLLLKCCSEPGRGNLKRGQGPDYCPNQTAQETNAVLTLLPLPFQEDYTITKPNSLFSTLKLTLFFTRRQQQAPQSNKVSIQLCFLALGPWSS